MNDQVRKYIDILESQKTDRVTEAAKWTGVYLNQVLPDSSWIARGSVTSPLHHRKQSLSAFLDES